MKKFKALQTKRHLILNKNIIGIDPGKSKQQAVVLNAVGILIGSPFTFRNNYWGFHKILWKKVTKLLTFCNPENTVFAIESSCNLWQKLAYFLDSKGYQVVLVSPLVTHHSRPMMNYDFSRTDPKDALMVANNARYGYFDLYQHYSTFIEAMHRDAVTYSKLRKDMVRNKQRIRSFMEHIFPEFLNILEPDTLTAEYLLSKYFRPEDFVSMNIFKKVMTIEEISRNQHGIQTLQSIQQAAGQTIGVPLKDEEFISRRIELDCWLKNIQIVRENIKALTDHMIGLAKQTKVFEILTSIMGISKLSAALFIGETRDLSQFKHYKQLEKMAGYKLKQTQSSAYMGPRRISHIGNKRFSTLLYLMTAETSRHIPEVRNKYLKRQIAKGCYRKNIVSCIPNLLKLIMALLKENHKYEFRDQNLQEMKFLEQKYDEVKVNRKKYKKAS
jgi:transposase